MSGPPNEIAFRDLTPETTNLFPRAFEAYPEMVRAEGAYVYDSNGNEYFDAVGGNQCSNIGHGHTAIAEAAREQIERMEYTSSMLFVNDQSQAFAAKLAEFLPDGFEHVWMVSGGSEANESAIKMAREYHRERGDEERYKVIGRRLGFHGNTLGTLGVGGHLGRRRPYIPMLEDTPKAPPAYPYRCEHCGSPTACREHGAECAKELETVIRDVGPEYVSAFIAEPVVGAANAGAAGGPEYFPTIRDICDDYGILLIVDEVMSGMGRTGSNFAIEHWDVTPDIITSAKGMSAGYSPLGGTMPHKRVVDVFADKDDGFGHGHTFCFNPTTSAIALAVLEYIDEHDVIENAREVGAYWGNRLGELYEYDFVGDVRGKGMMRGIEFVGDTETKEPLSNTGPEFRKQLLHTALEEGLTVYPGGGTIDGERGDHALLTPPLTISRSEVDLLMDRLIETFERIATDLDAQ